MPWIQISSLVLGFLHIFLVIHVGGKLIRNCKQVQRYVKGKHFIGLHQIVTNIVHVLLGADLEQGVVHHK